MIYCVKILIDSISRILNEFVILEGDQQELWEIDYEKKIAINISDLNIVENKMTRYDGTIKDYLTEKGFTEVHFHETGSLPSRAHYSSKRNCSFR
jgi:hypothetical protein